MYSWNAISSLARQEVTFRKIKFYSYKYVYRLECEAVAVSTDVSLESAARKDADLAGYISQ
jgi:hypothetical protein